MILSIYTKRTQKNKKENPDCSGRLLPSSGLSGQDFEDNVDHEEVPCDHNHYPHFESSVDCESCHCKKKPTKCVDECLPWTIDRPAKEHFQKLDQLSQYQCNAPGRIDGFNIHWMNSYSNSITFNRIV